MSLFMDLDIGRVMFATGGRNAATVKRFASDFLAAHGGEPETRIAEVCSEMSPAFIRGVGGYPPSAKITFDRYHIIAELNRAVDEVRKAERKSRPELRNWRGASTCGSNAPSASRSVRSRHWAG